MDRDRIGISKSELFAMFEVSFQSQKLADLSYLYFNKNEVKQFGNIFG